MFKFDDSKFIQAFSERLESVGYSSCYCKKVFHSKEKTHFEFTIKGRGQVSALLDHSTSKIIVKTSIKDNFFEKFRKISYTNNGSFIINDRSNDIVYFKNMLGFLGLKQSSKLFFRHLTNFINDLEDDSLIPDNKDRLTRIGLADDSFKISGLSVFNIDIIAGIEYFYIGETVVSKTIINFSFKGDFDDEVYSLNFDDGESNIKDKTIELTKTIFKEQLLSKIKSDFDVSPEVFESLSEEELCKYLNIIEMSLI